MGPSPTVRLTRHTVSSLPEWAVRRNNLEAQVQRVFPTARGRQLGDSVVWELAKAR